METQRGVWAAAAVFAGLMLLTAGGATGAPEGSDGAAESAAVSAFDRQVDAWLENTRQRLAIRPDQEAAWSGYADAYRAVAAQEQSRRALMQSMMSSGAGHQLDRSGRMQMHQAMRGMVGESRSRLESASQDLFAVLDDQQRQRARGVLF